MMNINFHCYECNRAFNRKYNYECHLYTSKHAKNCKKLPCLVNKLPCTVQLNIIQYLYANIYCVNDFYIMLHSQQMKDTHMNINNSIHPIALRSYLDFNRYTTTSTIWSSYIICNYCDKPLHKLFDNTQYEMMRSLPSIHGLDGICFNCVYDYWCLTNYLKDIPFAINNSSCISRNRVTFLHNRVFRGDFNETGPDIHASYLNDLFTRVHMFYMRQNIPRNEYFNMNDMVNGKLNFTVIGKLKKNIDMFNQNRG